MAIEFTKQDYINAGFSEDEIDEFSKKMPDSFARTQAKSLSRVAGVLLGTANAPLAFIKGGMNADIHNPEEFNQMGLLGKTATRFAGGLESAWRSISEKGSFGEDYDTYYKAKSGGRTLEQDYGHAAPLVKMGLDLMMDPMFGPALGIDLAKKGITSVPAFARYLKDGTMPLAGEARAIQKVGQTTLAETKIHDALNERELAEMQAMDDAARQEAIQKVRDTLAGRRDELAKIAEEDAAAHYGYSTIHGEVPDDPGITSYVDKLRGKVTLDNVAEEQLKAFEASVGDVNGPLTKFGYEEPAKPGYPVNQAFKENLGPLGTEDQLTRLALPPGERGFVLYGKPYSPEEFKNINPDTELRRIVFNDMIEGLKSGEAGLTTDSLEGLTQVTGRFTSNPDWLLEFMKDFKNKGGKGVTKDEIISTLNKVINERSLTEKQLKIKIKLDKVAVELEGNDHYQGIWNDLNKIGKQEIVIGDLNEGDKIFIDGEKFVHKGFDEEGNAIIKDGKTYNVDVFDRIVVDSVSKASGKHTEMNAVGGAVVGGTTQDEEGNLHYDIKNGLLGMAAGIGAKGILAKSSAGKVNAGMFGQIFNNSTNSTAQKVGAMYDKTIAARVERESITWGKTRDWLVRNLVDRSGNLKREAVKIDPVFGQELKMDMELRAGATTIASNMNEQYQKAIFHGLSSTEKELLNSIIQSKRIIAIDDYKGLGTVKHPDGLSGVEHLDYLDELEKVLPSGIFADLEARAGKYFDAMQEQLQYRLKEGLISQDQFNALSKDIYSPRQFMQHLDDSATQVRGGKKISVSEGGGIKALDEGSIGLLENNAQRLLEYNVMMTQDMISRNKANRSLLDFVQANPGNELASEARIVSFTKAGKPVFEDTPAGHELIRLYIDGEERVMHMPKEMAQEWINADPQMNHTLAQIIQWISGTKLVKAFATGYNPAFALSNIPRDVALVWGSTDQYSQHLPIALGQMGRDFAAVAKDVFTRSGRLLDYVNEGGGTELLTYYGRFSQAGEMGEKMNSIGKLLGWVGETSEIWTRLALRERAIRNGLSAKEATWQARNYLDFSQGGNIAKAFDNAMPYLNAGIQGTRSIFRYAKTNPSTFTYKMGQLGAISAGLYLANYMTNPETWEAVSDRDKEANFIITTPFEYTDKDGQLRRYYVKIPKDQGQRAVCTLFEGLMETYFEKKIPGKRMAQALGEFAGLGSLPPVFSALLAYMGNKDSWNWQDVWRGPKDVEPGQEWNADTHPLAVAAGQVTNLSPERGTRALGSMMPPNNAWVGLVSGGLRYITDGFNPKYEQETMEQMIMANPSIRRFLSSTSEINRYRTDIDQLKTQEITRRYKQSRELDKLTAAYFQDQDPGMRERIYQYVENAPAEDQDRLTKRVIRFSQTAQLPDRTWWQSVGGLPAIARAEAFLKRFDKESPAGQARMLSLADTVSGFSSSSFVDALVALKQRQAMGLKGSIPTLPIEMDSGELE